MDTSVAATNFGRWEEALLTRDPHTVAALYAPKATLIPTMAQKVIVDSEGIAAYFTFFGSFLPSVSLVESHVETIGHDAYLHCGVYRFSLTIDGAPTEVDARFSMIWCKNNDAWQLHHHHSSRIPEL